MPTPDTFPSGMGASPHFPQGFPFTRDGLLSSRIPIYTQIEESKPTPPQMPSVMFQFFHKNDRVRKTYLYFNLRTLKPTCTANLPALRKKRSVRTWLTAKSVRTVTALSRNREREPIQNHVRTTHAIAN